MTKVKWFVSTLVLLAVASGCSTKSESGSQPEAAAKETIAPVTLKAYFYQPGFTPEDFKEKLQTALQMKFPQISYDLIPLSKDTDIEKLIASGTIPDIIFAGEKEVPKLTSLDAIEDLNALIKKYKIDMEQFEPVAVNSIKKYSDTGETKALAFALQYYATFYNKNIFDKFGVNYPKDGMTWDQLIQLGKPMTKKEDNIQYYGILAGNASGLAQKYGLQIVDPKTNKSTFTSEAYQKLFAFAKQIYSNPEMLPPMAKMNTLNPVFTQDQNLAIFPWYGDGVINTLDQLQKSGKAMNWDMVSHPSMAETPGKSHELSFRSLVVTKQSQHKDAAFQVAAYIATSSDIQTDLSKNGYASSLKEEKFKKVFGEKREVLKGKNVAAIFKTTPLDIHKYTNYDDVAKKPLDAAFYEFLTGSIDANTALRKAEEGANAAISQAK
jgi:multiple sugar transport system substrate-binding protein